jgi:hypothetical protein
MEDIETKDYRLNKKCFTLLVQKWLGIQLVQKTEIFKYQYT